MSATINISTVRSNIQKIKVLDDKNYLDITLCLKLSLLEVCGFVECKINQIIFDYINLKIKDSKLAEILYKEISKDSYGIKYKKIKNKLFLILSKPETLKIEAKIDKKLLISEAFDLEHFKNCLCELENERDKYAHSFIRKNQGYNFGFSEIEERLLKIHKVLLLFHSYVKRRGKM